MVHHGCKCQSLPAKYKFKHKYSIYLAYHIFNVRPRVSVLQNLLRWQTSNSSSTDHYHFNGYPLHPEYTRSLSLINNMTNRNSWCTWKLLLKTASPLMTTCHVYNQCVGIITYVTADVTRHNAVCVWPIAYTPGVFVMLKATVGLQRKNDLFFSRQTFPGTCTVGVSVFGRESLGMWVFSDSRSTQRCHCSRTMDTHLHLANLSIT